MADPTIVRTGVNKVASATDTSQASQGVDKTGPSKFDQIRTQLAQKVSTDLKLPPPAQISEQQKTQLESELRKRLTGTTAGNAGQFFGVQRKNTQLQIQNLSSAVSKLPSDSSFTPIRERLRSIETQFQNSGTLINNTQDMNPQSLLKVQMQMYQLSENVELLSKVVDSVNSGVKTMLQMQV
ncbi:MAG: hypothetical protein JO323_24390 [Acidobacteriia bacterium]|nr:hypothetical protein [Terriglobia bacterium]